MYLSWYLLKYNTTVPRAPASIVPYHTYIRIQRLKNVRFGPRSRGPSTSFRWHGNLVISLRRQGGVVYSYYDYCEFPW